MNNISRPKSYKKRQPLPRGIHGGKKCGRGQTGQKSRETVPRITGGQFPRYRRINKVGFFRQSTKHDLIVLNTEHVNKIFETNNKPEVITIDMIKEYLKLNKKVYKNSIVRILLNVKSKKSEQPITVECHKCSSKVEDMFNIIKK